MRVFDENGRGPIEGMKKGGGTRPAAHTRTPSPMSDPLPGGLSCVTFTVRQCQRGADRAGYPLDPRLSVPVLRFAPYKELD